MIVLLAQGMVMLAHAMLCALVAIVNRRGGVPGTRPG